MLVLTRVDYVLNWVYISLDEEALSVLQDAFVFLNKIKCDSEIDFGVLCLNKARSRTSWILKAETAIKESRHNSGISPKGLIFPLFVQGSNGFYYGDGYDRGALDEVLWGLGLYEKFLNGDLWPAAMFIKKELESLRLAKYVSPFMGEIVGLQEGLNRQGKKREGRTNATMANKIKAMIHWLKTFTDNNIAEANNAINNSVI